MKALLFTDEDFTAMQRLFETAVSDTKLFDLIVNAPFHLAPKAVPLGLGAIVLLLVNKSRQTIDRVALSKTEHAKGAVEYSVKPFHEIRIPLTHTKNIIAKAIKTGRFQHTSDWQYLFIPDLSPEEARFNQAGAGVSYSYVYPLPKVGDGGALIFSFFVDPKHITSVQTSFMERYAAMVAKRLRA